LIIGLAEKLGNDDFYSVEDDNSGHEMQMMFAQKRDSPKKDLPGEREEESTRKESMWNKALLHLKQNNFNEAYSLILSLNDNLYLIRFLGRTGCHTHIASIHHLIAKELLSRIISLINSHEFVHHLLPWVSSFVDKDIVHPELSQSLLDTLLALLTSEDYMEQVELCEINRLINVIGENIHENRVNRLHQLESHK
jgi:hypothetical protein